MHQNNWRVWCLKFYKAWLWFYLLPSFVNKKNKLIQKCSLEQNYVISNKAYFCPISPWTTIIFQRNLSLFLWKQSYFLLLLSNCKRNIPLIQFSWSISTSFAVLATYCPVYFGFYCFHSPFGQNTNLLHYYILSV